MTGNTAPLDAEAAACVTVNLERLAVQAAAIARITGVSASGQGGPIMRVVKRCAFRLLRQAEALARRLLILMAVQYDIAFDRVPTSSTDGPKQRDAEKSESPPRAPLFRLTDPLPPLGLIASETAPPAPDFAWAALDYDPQELVSATGLAPRIAALLAVIEAPDKAAARMAGWIAQSWRSAGEGFSRRGLPLTPGGLPRKPRRRGQHDLFHSALLYTHSLSMRVLRALIPPD